ncbi:hypothetical protein J4G53_22465 [Serratia ureilytica]|uniref:hypothetical protein n=1 Tax=Serratia TaxID=613 RepID=UPI000D8C97E1|nr:MULTISPECIES: hypothetical protein [Serratia]MBO1811018.1 hypothetical protein [Serratia ureilytica]PYA05823.1 hypothetical protein DMW43_09920 [Serratia marcescens]PYA50544.1 hypothetical protein DMW45_04800 [Serratia marcescens]HAT3683304.1 hypothetical protein [Serratia marcescens]
MKNKEPKIIADGISNEAVLEWMQEKVSASRHLQTAILERAHLQKALADVEEQISQLTKKASVEVSRYS